MFRKFVYNIFPLLFVTLLLQTTQAGAKTPALTGTVAETMNASGYTYMLIENKLGKTWVAIPETTVTKGEVVSYLEGMVMKDFHSNSLDKTFDTIIFSSGLQGEKPTSFHGTAKVPQKDIHDSFAEAVKAEQMAAQPMKNEVVSGGSAGAVVPFAEVQIERAKGENGYTIEEIFTKKKSLHGKKVRVKGKVVKYNPNIMGRNWIHLQDGTGNPMQNSHDLVVTSTEAISLDEIIIAEGVLSTNKDFGAGYTYEVIVEEATFLK